MTPKTVLICTVGGSHQPIVTAIRDLRPDHVYFVCSGKDLGTEKPGSDTQMFMITFLFTPEDENPIKI